VIPSSFSCSFLAWAHAELGEFDEGARIGAEGVRIAEAANHPFSQGYAHLGMGILHLRRGDLQWAIFALERALAKGAFADVPVGYAYVAFHLGYALALAGRLSVGLPMLEKTVGIAEAKGFVARHSLRLAYLGEVYLLAGRFEEAAATGSRALALAVERRERANEAYALRVLGRIAMERREPGEAAARFREALAIASDLEMRPLLAHCHMALADTLERSDAPAGKGAHRASAKELLSSMGMRTWDVPVESDMVVG